MYSQAFRFIFSGGLATGSHWSVMALMVSTGVSPGKATAAGAIVGAVVNYILQYKLTFQYSQPYSEALSRYLWVCATTWLSNLILFLTLHNMLQLPTIFAQLITTLAVAFMSYIMYKRIVFNDH